MLDAGIYFVASEVGPIKIGYSQKISKRMMSLQTSSPVRLELLAVVAGTPRLERQIHDRFEDLRLNGEWFDRGAELLQFIETVKVDPWHRPLARPRPGRPRKSRELKQTRRDRPIILTRRIVQLLEATRSKQWRCREVADTLDVPRLERYRVSAAMQHLHKKGRIARPMLGRYTANSEEDGKV